MSKRRQPHEIASAALIAAGRVGTVAGFSEGFSPREREHLREIVLPYCPRDEIADELVRRVESAVELYGMSAKPERLAKMQKLDAFIAAARGLDPSFDSDLQLELNYRQKVRGLVDLSRFADDVRLLVVNAIEMRRDLEKGERIPDKSLAEYECAYRIALAWHECTGALPSVTRNKDAVSGPQSSPFQRLIETATVAAPPIGDSVLRGAVERLGRRMRRNSKNNSPKV
jgi:hypothetical protein